jgi:transglutaminase-like putative cysteine protease
MKKSFKYLAYLCLIVIVIGIIFLITRKPHTQEPVYTIPRHLQYSFTLQNRTNRVLKKAEFWTYAPAKQTATQLLVHLESSFPYLLITDDLGNQVLHFTFHNLAPYATRIITIKAELLLSNTPNTLPEKDLGAYLQAEKYCESDDPEISRLAEGLKGPKPIRTAENIFRWVSGNVQYSGYLKNPRGALYALRAGRGDCTEFMYLSAALSRANNIPTRGVGGYVIKENGVLSAAAYHNWVEFYDGGVWRFADPQKKIFMKDPSHYIAMNLFGKTSNNPIGDHRLFRFSGNGLKVRMN